MKEYLKSLLPVSVKGRMTAYITLSIVIVTLIICLTVSGELGNILSNIVE